MKDELLNPVRLKLPFELLKGDKEDDPLNKLGYFLQAALDTTGKINISKVWMNKSTDEILDKLIVEYFRKIRKMANDDAHKQLNMYKLAFGPAVDYLDTFLLEDGYIYIEEDFKI